MLNTGIYQIKNKISGKVYIGSTNNFEKRKKTHFKELMEGRHINKGLQTDFTKLGENAFMFSIIEYTWNSNRLQKEQEWINKLKKSGKLYNVATANVTRKSIKSEFVQIIKIIWRALVDKLL